MKLLASQRSDAHEFSYGMLDYGVFYRLDTPLISEPQPGGGPAHSLTALLDRYGVRLAARDSRQNESTVDQAASPPYLSKVCVLKVKEGSLRIGGAMGGDDIFFLPVLFETLVDLLGSTGSVASAGGRTEMAYRMSIVLGPEQSSGVLRRLATVDGWIGPTRAGSFQRMRITSTGDEERVLVMPSKTGIRCSYRMAKGCAIRPAEALAQAESGFWAVIEGMGLPRVACF